MGSKKRSDPSGRSGSPPIGRRSIGSGCQSIQTGIGAMLDRELGGGLGPEEGVHSVGGQQHEQGVAAAETVE